MTDCEEDNISLKCLFFDDTKINVIYDEFRKMCSISSDREKCFAGTHDNSVDCSDVPNKLKASKSKLNETLQKYERELNNIFPNGNVEDVKKQCICLKQSFYDKVIKVVKEKTKDHELFKTCNNEIKDTFNDLPSNLCTFRYLNFREMKKMKMIFDFYLFYYRNINNFTIEQKPSQYPKYFKKGFYEHCNSILQCLNNTTQSEYCKEFKEYHKKYNAFEVFLESLILYGENANGSDCDNGCVLGESLLTGKYLLELKQEIERIRSRYRPTNYSTTVITVVFLIIGTIIGAFLISYYFFGITPRELWLRIRKLNKETHAIVDDETENNSLFTSENQENTFKNNGYTISYESTNYS
ncbi:PIR Superfamily Protein [Plasmodium ovale wallikeri]|uniref:PIR Superfamily Protein n=1 Tax=Plasmodium ovale wallikeri TaxID=864142 RepID=A0A1A9AGW2_PLAOA|nr:PIR Superfamily Protein [Plasmodium ovale wallikeri]SBT56636.1 PIR Superfamily Protein [Plasmodium ovale wallikeri]